MEPMHDLVAAATQSFQGRLVEAVSTMHRADDAHSFAAAERELVDLARELAASMTARVLQAVSDDQERREAALERVRDKAANKGITLRIERNRLTKVRTLGGQIVEVTTPYATARPRGDGTRATRGRQGTGVYPVLDQLGIQGRSTPALRLLVSLAVSEANSVGAARALLAGAGLDIGHKAALRLTYSVSEDALRARRDAMKATTSGNPNGEFAGRRVVVAVDGGRVRIRRRVAGRPRKGGRKHFVTEWREPKLLTVYVVDDSGKRDRTVPAVIDGTLGDADALFDLLRYHLLRLGAHLASTVIMLGDGAKWIWNRAPQLQKALGLSDDQFVEVADYFHVVERLGELSKTRTRWSDEQRETWLSDMKEKLNQDDVEGVVSEMRRLLARKGDALETELEYWERNKARVRYARFREEAIPIGSGAVESTVRRVVNLRLKGASIAWTEEHAEGILHLRSHAKSGRWNELERAVLAVTGWSPTARRVRAPS